MPLVFKLTRQCPYGQSQPVGDLVYAWYTCVDRLDNFRAHALGQGETNRVINLANK